MTKTYEEEIRAIFNAFDEELKAGKAVSDWTIDMISVLHKHVIRLERYVAQLKESGK